MMEYQQRVNNERDALNEKIISLRKFLGTEPFDAIPHDEQFRLRLQYDLMCLYRIVLSERINNF